MTQSELFPLQTPQESSVASDPRTLSQPTLFQLGVRLPLVEPPSKALAVILGTLGSTEIHTVQRASLTVAKLQSACGALAKLPSMRWSGIGTETVSVRDSSPTGPGAGGPGGPI